MPTGAQWVWLWLWTLIVFLLGAWWAGRDE